MPSSISITTPIQVPYGKPEEWNIWIKDPVLGENNFSDHVIEHVTTKRLNKLWFSDIVMEGVDVDSKNFVKEGNIIKIFSENNLWFKGKIVKVEYQTETGARVRATGMAVKLVDHNTDTIHTNTATSTIVSNLVADESSLNLGTNQNYGNVTINIDDQNNLQAISDLADAVEFNWYESQDTYPYDIDSINFVSRQGSSTPVMTFTSSGDNANSYLNSNEKDVERFANHVTVLGYGDGVNQIKAINFHATDNRTKLTADLTASATTMTVDDTSAFNSSGDLWVGQEKISYTGKTATTFTGLTRGVAFMGNVTEAYAHDTGIEVYDAQYTKTSAEAGSSIADNGLKEGLPINFPSIIDQNFADRMAQGILAKEKDPLERIVIEAGDPFEVLGQVVLGDKVTATDTEVDISGDHDIVGLVGGFDSRRGDFLELELSNKRISLIDEIQSIQQTTAKTAQFMQGATNIYTASNYENCDNSTPLSMRFYLPAEAVIINKILLKAIMKKYRAYHTTTSSESSHTHSVDAQTSVASNTDHQEDSSSASGAISTGGGTLTSTVSTTDPSFDGDYNLVLVDIIVDNSSSSANGWDLRIRNTTTATDYLNTTNFVPGDGIGRSIIILVDGDIGGDSIEARVTNNSDAADIVGLSISVLQIGEHTHSISSFTSNAGSSHSHGTDFAISEDTFPAGSPTVKVEVGEDGGSLTEVSGSPFTATDGGAINVDITDEVKDVGADKWVEVKFTPQSGSDHNKMRIEANNIIQIFIKSV